MLSFGQELYRLTARDEETLLIEPFFRNRFFSIGAAVLSDSITFDTPQDRALYVGHVAVNVNPGAAQTTNVIAIFASGAQASQGTIKELRGVLRGDGESVAVAGANVAFNFPLHLVLPPGGKLQVFVQKSAAANAGSANVHCAGYLIPPGRIGRGT